MNKVNFFNLHLPSEVRVFEVHESNIKLFNHEVIVFDVKNSNHTLFRSYSFFNEWFEINCSFDLNGHLLPEEGPITWSFNCDISTPCFKNKNNIFNVDLEYDVLVNPNGKDFVIIDEDDFCKAVTNDYLSLEEQAGALRGLDKLTSIIHKQGLSTYLDTIYPFEDVVNCDIALPMCKKEIGEVPALLGRKSNQYSTYRD
ncbi:hypothetical protein J14TS2_48850 [Bacillus sp. J14TS2]|uniref:DUF402 domain-containing protein n=1 Tax=Bacillus sp. J14TS2 TaxID=2807188 RepID=UPI001B21F707|nr:DUF402 domain-containing protein [Bacillus sp. J14TS2]GIN74410.1 hypothetical protein J14TS2_48850 [Bacillus sp. J14TS2]